MPCPTNFVCDIHKGVQLVYLSCKAKLTLKVLKLNQCVEIIHKGKHDHPKPHKIRPPPRKLKKFESMVLNAQEATPIALQVGTTTRMPVGALDSSFVNLDRQRYLTHKIRQKHSWASDLSSIIALDNQSPYKLITKSSFKGEDGCIIFQTRGMKEVMMGKKHALQTDTIEGYIFEPTLPSANVTMTTTFCDLLNISAPIQIAVLFGKSAPHYVQYFEALIEAHELPTLDDFDKEWPGNVCDFSDAERVAFKSALQRVYGIPEEKEIDVESYYGCCEVHFDRSLARISNNHSIVPHQRKADFVKMVKELLENLTVDEFNKKTDAIMKEFKHSKNWLNWYLHSDRAPLIFPAMGKVTFMENRNHTNSQESMGNLIQMSTPVSNPSMAVAFHHLYSFAMTRVDWEYSSKKCGMPLRYGIKPKKRSRHNDGKAPERTNELINLNQRKAGRPRYSKNVAPSKSSIQPLTFGIPWSYKVGQDLYINTCAMDSALMILYFMRKFELLPLQLFTNEQALDLVLNEISAEEYTKGRIAWIEYNNSVEKTIEKTRVIQAKQVSEHKWDCWNTIPTIVQEISFFKFEYRLEYGPCSTHGNQCSNAKSYTDHETGDSAAQSTRSSYIAVDHPDICSLQERVFDQFYNNPGDEVLCGAGTSWCKKSMTDESGYDSDCIVRARKANCDGKRKVRKHVLNAPPVLHVSVRVSVQLQNSNFSVNALDQSLQCFGAKYVLTAVILNNGVHFCKLTLIGGKCLLYDGMFGKNKLRWWSSANNISSIGGGFHVSELWYVLDEDHARASTMQTVVGGVGSDHNSTESMESDSDVSSGIPEPDKKPSAIKSKTKNERNGTKINKKGNNEQKQKKKKAQCKYPVGLSIFPVSPRGPLPECKYCRAKMKRGDHHAIVRGVQRTEGKSWHSVDHYHLKCFIGLSKEQQAQLSVQLEEYDDLSLSDRTKWIRKINNNNN